MFNKIFIFCFNKTALHVAVENNHLEIVRILLSHPKIDVNIKYIFN